MMKIAGKQNLLHVMDYINQYALMVLIFSFPYNLSYRLLPLALFFITAIAGVIIKKQWTAVSWNHRSLYFLLLLFFFSLIFIYYPFEHPYPKFQLLLEHRLSLLGFGLIGLTALFSNINLRKIYYCLIGSALLAIGILLCIKIGWLFTDGRHLSFVELRQMYMNYHMGFNFSLNMGLAACGYFLVTDYKKNPLKKQLLLLAAYLCIFVVVLQSEGRSGFLSAILLTGFFSLMFLHTYFRKFFWGCCIVIPAVLFYIAQGHYKLQPEVLDREPRRHLFDNAVILIKEKPLFGYGTRGAQFYADSVRYAKHQADSTFVNFWTNEMVDSHNQYLQTTVEFGLFGLSILLMLLFLPFFFTAKQYRLFMFCFTCLIAFQSLFDVTLFVPEFGVIFGVIMVVHIGNKYDGLRCLSKPLK